jgi:site-specific recombinase XerD
MEKSEIIELFSKQLISNDCSVYTGKSYLHCIILLLDFLTEKKISVLDKNAVFSFIEECKIRRKLSNSSMRQVTASIKFLFQQVLHSDIDFSFISKLKKQINLPVILTREEIKSLLDSYKDLKHLTIITTIYSCGLHLSELFNLNVYDVDFRCSSITIADPGGKNTRHMILCTRLQKLLHEYIEEYKPKYYLFEGNNGNRYSKRSIQAIFKKGIKTAGITKEVSVYTLRHSFASHLLDNGTDIKYLQILLGHKQLSTTQRYLLISPFSIEKIMNPLETL